jgi:hypothetical protein
LTASSAKCGPHIGPLAGLEQYNHDQGDTYDNMNDNQYGGHHVFSLTLNFIFVKMIVSNFKKETFLYMQQSHKR